MSAREIITVQVGHSANFVGTHFWNIQDAYFESSDEPEINHDVLFRAGLNVQGEETYTPRLVLLDLKGSLGSLKKASPLYEAADEEITTPTWSGKVQKYEEEPYVKNAFLRGLDEDSTDNKPETYADHLDTSVSVWSDFNKLYYHPKTVLEIHNYMHDDDKRPFSTFAQGTDVFAQADFIDQLFDERIRFFAEECDSLQGFNVLADALDGFSGIGASLLELINDEFPKNSSVCFGIHKPAHPQSEKQSAVISLNAALLMDAGIRNSQLYVPLYAPTSSGMATSGWSKYLTTDFRKPYHWSAFLAAGIETVLLPTRLKANPIGLLDMADVVRGGTSRKVGALSVGLPLPLHTHTPYTETLRSTRGEVPWMVDLTSCLTHDNLKEGFGQCAVVRGIPKLAVSQSVEGQRRSPSTNETLQALDKMLQTAVTGPYSQNFSLRTPLPIAASFPQFFAKQVDADGLIVNGKLGRQGPVHQVGALARLHMSPQLSKLVMKNSKCMLSVSASVVGLYERGGDVTREDFRAKGEDLAEVAYSYGDIDEE
ncbi:Protein misato 1 [Gaertneriomyces sp. JEL0708]|nr:Protein misato 1 [Gaertneriomyces sp. JEL0708]